MVNKLAWYDDKHTVEARTVTYEGLEMYCNKEKVSKHTKLFEHLNKVMWQIYNHVKKNISVQILSGQFFFKIDAQDKLNLLFAKQIQCD